MLKTTHTYQTRPTTTYPNPHLSIDSNTPKVLANRLVSREPSVICLTIVRISVIKWKKCILVKMKLVFNVWRFQIDRMDGITLSHTSSFIKQKLSSLYNSS